MLGARAFKDLYLRGGSKGNPQPPDKGEGRRSYTMLPLPKGSGEDLPCRTRDVPLEMKGGADCKKVEEFIVPGTV